MAWHIMVTNVIRCCFIRIREREDMIFAWWLHYYWKSCYDQLHIPGERFCSVGELSGRTVDSLLEFSQVFPTFCLICLQFGHHCLQTGVATSEAMMSYSFCSLIIFFGNAIGWFSSWKQEQHQQQCVQSNDIYFKYLEFLNFKWKCFCFWR